MYRNSGFRKLDRCGRIHRWDSAWAPAAASALVFSTALAVLVGNQAARYLDMVPLKLIAGIGFVAIGCWAIVEHFRGA